MKRITIKQVQVLFADYHRHILWSISADACDFVERLQREGVSRKHALLLFARIGAEAVEPKRKRKRNGTT